MAQSLMTLILTGLLLLGQTLGIHTPAGNPKPSMTSSAPSTTSGPVFSKARPIKRGRDGRRG